VREGEHDASRTVGPEFGTAAPSFPVDDRLGDGVAAPLAALAGDYRAYLTQEQKSVEGALTVDPAGPQAIQITAADDQRGAAME
jgi:hypothetical protein